MKQMWSKEEIEKVSKATPKDITTLFDSAGNPRFIEGEGTSDTLTGVTITYNKWSLSGTHLMFVVAGEVASSTSLANGDKIGIFNLPTWILDKIYGVWASGTNEYIEQKGVAFTDNNFGATYSNFVLTKTSTEIQIKKVGASTITNASGFRVQFDLLIDTE